MNNIAKISIATCIILAACDNNTTPPQAETVVAVADTSETSFSLRDLCNESCMGGEDDFECCPEATDWIDETVAIEPDLLYPEVECVDSCCPDPAPHYDEYICYDPGLNQ